MQQLKEVSRDLLNLSDVEAFQKLFAVAMNSKFSVALWRLPNQENKHLVMDASGQKNSVVADLEELQRGFIFSSFLEKEDRNSLFIKDDIYFGTSEKVLKIADRLDSSIFRDIYDNLLNYNELSSNYYVNKKNNGINSTTDLYIDLVEKSIKMIKEGAFEKVVPSMLKVTALNDNFDVVEVFEKLCDKYSNALISVVSIPDVGTWIGATPEVLISVEQSKIFKTVALAGTQKIDKDVDLMEVAWRQKEIEEQAMVSRYIINRFKKIRLREFKEIGPRTARAGTLTHLKTDFVVDMQATNFQNLGTVMLKLLHPTSAVCGMPKEPATDFLMENEKHDREFYSGFLGPVNMFNDTYLFVNIRCMQLLKDKALLYAGAGVTRNSDATAEWIEANWKCDILESVINNK